MDTKEGTERKEKFLPGGNKKLFSGEPSAVPVKQSMRLLLDFIEISQARQIGASSILHSLLRNFACFFSAEGEKVKALRLEQEKTKKDYTGATSAADTRTSMKSSRMEKIEPKTQK